MSTYILSSCFLRNISDKIYITEILYRFTQQNAFKVGIDKEKKVIDIYSKIAENRPEVASWLSIMSFEPSSFEEICELGSNFTNEDEIFLFLCWSVVNQHKMIIFSFQSLASYNFKTPNLLEYKDKTLTILDRDDALIELSFGVPTTIITNSIVATNGSSIERSKNA